MDNDVVIFYSDGSRKMDNISIQNSAHGINSRKQSTCDKITVTTMLLQLF